MSNRSWMLRVLPFAFYISIMAAMGCLSQLGWNLPWLYALRVGGVSFLLLWFWKEYSELIAPCFLKFTDLLISVLAGLLVFYLWINLDQSWMSFGSSRGYAPLNTVGGIDWPLALVRLFGAAMVVPVMEELFWRSFLMRWIDRHDFLRLSPSHVSVRAFLISSLLFASEHTLWLAGLLAGFVFAGLYIRTRNLWAAIISHMVANAALGVWVINTRQWSFW